MDKTRIIDAVRRALTEELAAVEDVAKMAMDEATNAESKAENKYDTRSLEASYLARGQAERVVALRRLVAFFEALVVRPAARAGVGAVVILEDAAGAERHLLMVPDGGGRRISVDADEIVLVTPQSPLGAALLGKEEGDELAHRTSAFEVTAVF